MRATSISPAEMAAARATTMLATIRPGGNGQSTQTLFGKILRIHPEAAPGTYTIPPDNPFFGQPPPVKQEIWAYGLRNPWQFSWDRQTRAMFIGDVGQATREEIDVQKPSNPGGGENYGWRFKEGFVQSPCSQPTPPPGLTDPIFDYEHTTGICIIGGYVYRGSKVRDLRGLYVFADTFGPDGGDFTGKIWTLPLRRAYRYRISKTSLRSCFRPVSAIFRWPTLLPFGRTTVANFIFVLTATGIFTRFFDRIRPKSVFRQLRVKKARRLLPCPANNRPK